MIIGIPKEIKQQENRVSLLPSAAYQLTKRGHTVLVEKNAGVGTGYPDADYIAAGAKIIDNARDLFQQAEMIVKVKEPLPAEYSSCARDKSFSLTCILRRVAPSPKRS